MGGWEKEERGVKALEGQTIQRGRRSLVRDPGLDRFAPRGAASFGLFSAAAAGLES